MINGVYDVGVDSGYFPDGFGYFLASMPMLKMQKRDNRFSFSCFEVLNTNDRTEDAVFV